jgi:hypothetical protein
MPCTQLASGGDKQHSTGPHHSATHLWRIIGDVGSALVTALEEAVLISNFEYLAAEGVLVLPGLPLGVDQLKLHPTSSHSTRQTFAMQA